MAGNKQYKLPGSEGVCMIVCDSIADARGEIATETHTWLNLTNGVEMLPFMGYCGDYFKFCRFRSCSFEQKHWSDAIADMPDDMLINLALGNQQSIIDFGANRPCSRALRQGIPIAIRRISLSWGLDVDEHMWIFGRNGKPIRVDDEFAKEAMRLDNKQKSRLDYFKRFVDTDRLLMDIICAPTNHDGDYELHSDIVKKYCK